MSNKTKEVKKEKDVCTRNWDITIQNPKDIGLEHEQIKKILKKSKNKVKYAGMVDEIAPTTGTPHTHLTIIFTNPIRRSTLTGAKWFKNSHCEEILSIQGSIDYLTKANHPDKKDTQVEGTFEEIGTRPIIKEKKEPKEKLTDIIMKYLEAGMSTAEMIKEDSRLINKIRDIELTRQLFISKEYMVQERKLKVVYIQGSPGTGKTTYVYTHHDPESICRVTHYSSSRGILFDNYESGKHDVLVFEDWNSITTPIQNMLAWLDKWGTSLPARYSDKCATYHTVYIISNIPYENQYAEYRYTNMELYSAWNRRINIILKFQKKSDGSVEILELRNNLKESEESDNGK